MATIPLSTTVTNDGNRLEDMLTVSAFKGVGLSAETGDPADDNDGPLMIAIADKNELPTITAVLTDADGMAVTDNMVTEGMTYMLTLTADPAATEDIMVALTGGGTADPQDDYSLGMSDISIASGSSESAAVSLEIDLNDDLDNEILMFSAVVSGEAMYGDETTSVADLLSLTIVDATSRLVWVKEGAAAAIETAMMNAGGADGLTVGDNFTVAKSALFEAAAGYSVRVGAISSDTDVARAWDGAQFDDTNVNVEIWARSVGTATITLTGSAVSPSSAVSSRQVSVDVAEITFDVMVGLAAPGHAAEPDGHAW